MSTAIYGNDKANVQVVHLNIGAQSALTGVLSGGSIANPHGQTLLIVGASIRVTTASTGASTVDVGVAANATTSSDTLLDGVSLATLGVVSALGTNGGKRTWGASEFVTVAEASGDVAGFAGVLTIEYTFI